MLNEVLLARQANELLDHYRQQYEQRYHSQPAIPNITMAGTTLKDMIRTVGGFERAKRIVTQFIKMNGERDYFRNSGHTIECLRRVYPTVAASVPDDKVVAMRQPKDLRIMFWTVCPQCKADFEVTCWASEADKFAHTKLCDKCLSDPPDAA